MEILVQLVPYLAPFALFIISWHIRSEISTSAHDARITQLREDHKEAVDQLKKETEILRADSRESKDSIHRLDKQVDMQELKLEHILGYIVEIRTYVKEKSERD